MTKDNSYHCFYADEKIDNFERMALAEASDKKFLTRMPSDPNFGLVSNSKVVESGCWTVAEGGLKESIEENEGNSVGETGQSGSRIQMISPLPDMNSGRGSSRVKQGLSPRKKTIDSYELEQVNSGYTESQPDLDKIIQLPERKDTNNSLFSTPNVKKLPKGHSGKDLPIKGRNLAHSFGSEAPFLSHMQKPSWTMNNFGSKKIGSPLFYLKNNDLHFRDMDLKAELGLIKLIDHKDLENSCASSTIGMPNPIFRDDVLNMSNLTTLNSKFLLQFELKSLGNINIRAVRQKIFSILKNNYIQYTIESLLHFMIIPNSPFFTPKRKLTDFLSIFNNLFQIDPTPTHFHFISVKHSLMKITILSRFLTLAKDFQEILTKHDLKNKGIVKYVLRYYAEVGGEIVCQTSL